MVNMIEDVLVTPFGRLTFRTCRFGETRRSLQRLFFPVFDKLDRFYCNDALSFLKRKA